VAFEGELVELGGRFQLDSGSISWSLTSRLGPSLSGQVAGLRCKETDGAKVRPHLSGFASLPVCESASLRAQSLPVCQFAAAKMAPHWRMNMRVCV